jgi:hypothetical protein
MLKDVVIDTDIVPFAACIAERVRWSMETTAKGDATMPAA